MVLEGGWFLTCLEQLDGLRALVRLAHLVLLHDVVLDLLVALHQRLEARHHPPGEVGDARRAGGLRVGQVDVDHEDVRQHAGGKEDKVNTAIYTIQISNYFGNSIIQIKNGRTFFNQISGRLK